MRFFIIAQHIDVATKKTQLTHEYLIEKKRLCEVENQRLAVLQPLAQLVDGVFLFLHILYFFDCKNTKHVCHNVTHFCLYLEILSPQKSFRLHLAQWVPCQTESR